MRRKKIGSMPPSSLRFKNHADRMWSFSLSHSYLPHDLVMGCTCCTVITFSYMKSHPLSSPRLFLLLIFPLCCRLLSAPQHPEAQKQTSIPCSPQKPAPVPLGASSGNLIQDPHREEDTSAWHQGPTQTGPDTCQGTAPDGHCSRRGNEPRVQAAWRAWGEKEWVLLPWRWHPSFKVIWRFWTTLVL